MPFSRFPIELMDGFLKARAWLRSRLRSRAGKHGHVPQSQPLPTMSGHVSRRSPIRPHWYW
jgi:hypothetical protein